MRLGLADVATRSVGSQPRSARVAGGAGTYPLEHVPAQAQRRPVRTAFARLERGRFIEPGQQLVHTLAPASVRERHLVGGEGVATGLLDTSLALKLGHEVGERRASHQAIHS